MKIRNTPVAKNVQYIQIIQMTNSFAAFLFINIFDFAENTPKISGCMLPEMRNAR